MAPVLQCPDCGTKHPIDVASDAAAFRCSGCGRTLKVPEQFRAAAAGRGARRARGRRHRDDGDRRAEAAGGDRTGDARSRDARSAPRPAWCRSRSACSCGSSPSRSDSSIVFGAARAFGLLSSRPARRRVPRDRLEPVLAGGPPAAVRRAGHRVDRRTSRSCSCRAGVLDTRCVRSSRSRRRRSSRAPRNRRPNARRSRPASGTGSGRNARQLRRAHAGRRTRRTRVRRAAPSTGRRRAPRRTPTATAGCGRSRRRRCRASLASTTRPSRNSMPAFRRVEHETARAVQRPHGLAAAQCPAERVAATRRDASRSRLGSVVKPAATARLRAPARRASVDERRSRGRRCSTASPRGARPRLDGTGRVRRRPRAAARGRRVSRGRRSRSASGTRRGGALSTGG